MIKDLIEKNRSFRRFHEETIIENDVLRELIDLARLSASGGNKQSLKFIISNETKKNGTIFSHLTWAGHLKDWDGPEQGERPSAYIIIVGDTQISTSCGCDHGIAAQSILLGAAEKGLGGCMLGSIQRNKLRTELDIPQQYEILLVLALGKPAEKVVIEETGDDGDIKYWRDEDGVHHVPKRRLNELIIEL